MKRKGKNEKMAEMTVGGVSLGSWTLGTWGG